MANMNKYRSAFTQADLMGASTVCAVGVPVKLGEYVVNAKEIIELGYGMGGQDGALGRLYADIKKAGPTSVKGRLRLIIASPQDIPLAVVFEARTEETSFGATDPTQRMPFNAQELLTQVSEDNKIQFWFISDTADTVTKADSSIVMSISRYIPV
jgi:hypothetical protein